MTELSPRRRSSRRSRATCALGRRPPPLHRHRAYRLPHRGRPVRHPGHPPVAHQALRRHPAAMGFAVNASTMGMAVSGLAVGYFSRAIDRRKGILLSLARARDPDHSARSCARPHHLHPAARGAGALHGCRLHPHACLSRRALQRGRLGERVCRLHHRQRRQQSDRAADLGGRRRPFRSRRQFLLLRLAQSARRGARLFHRREGAADEGHGRQA